ncbi:tRNA-splicing endonuclease subunit sen34 [Usnea florida]
MTAPTAPTIPFPIFQVSQKVERYLLYDIDIITWLRRNHNILGVLIGTLPQIPSQNVFLGLPLELQPEEARLLVESGLAYIVNDLEWHSKSLASKDVEQKEAIRADLKEEGARLAKDFESNKKSRTQNALKKIQAKRSSATGQQSAPTPAPTNEEDTSEDALFGEPLTRDTTIMPSPKPSQTPEPDLKPWTLTPTTSSPLLSPPRIPNPPTLPTVNPSSYALFKHLHNLGYFLTPGIRFGCQFSVYPGDPLRFHSHFLSMSAGWDEEFDLLDLIGGGRLGTGVKKGWLVGGKRGSDDGAGVRTFCIEWGGM